MTATNKSGAENPYALRSIYKHKKNWTGVSGKDFGLYSENYEMARRKSQGQKD